MIRQWLRPICGWVAVFLSTALACFWAVWGILENFHEGWYNESLARNLALMLVQYLSPMLVFVAMGLVAVRWPWPGAALHAAVGLFALWFFRPLYTTVTLLITGPLLAVGLLHGFGRPRPRWLATALLLGLPLIVLVACGAEPVVRIAGRVDDGDRSARLVDGNGVRLVWAPRGPGWPDRGVTWDQAVRLCAYLSDDGTALLDTPQNVWRLPTAEEAVRSMARHGQNCGGTWDGRPGLATYQVRPDKESPLWDTRSKVLYWWTATEADAGEAYIVVYNGSVWRRRKEIWPAYLSFRAVRSPG
jgi:hypothetical protein